MTVHNMILPEFVRTEVCARNWESINETLVPELNTITEHQAEYDVEKRAAILDRLQKIDRAAHPKLLIRLFRKIVHGRAQPTDEVLGKVRGTIATLQSSLPSPTDKISPANTIINPPSILERLKHRWNGGKEAFAEAVKAGNVPEIMKGLQYGINPSGRDRYEYRSYLHIAICSGNIEVARLLIAAGANVNQEDIRHVSPLTAACSYGRKDLVELLLNNGAYAKGQIGTNALYAVCSNKSNDQLAIAQLLMNAGASPIRLYCYEAYGDNYGDSPLMTAISARNMPLVQALTAKDIDLNVGNGWWSGKKRENHLEAAAVAGNVAILEYLLEKGLRLDDWRGTHALIKAAKAGNIEMVRALVERGVPANAGFDGETAINSAIKSYQWYSDRYREHLIHYYRYPTPQTAAFFEDKLFKLHECAQVIQELLIKGVHPEGTFHFEHDMLVLFNSAMTPDKNGFAPLRTLMPLIPISSWDLNRIVETFPTIAKNDPTLASLFLRLELFPTNRLSIPKEDLDRLEKFGAAASAQDLDSSKTPVKILCRDGVSVSVHPDLLRGEFPVFTNAFEMEAEDIAVDVDSMILEKILQDIQGVQKLSPSDLRSPTIAKFLHEYASKSFEVIGLDRRGRSGQEIFIAPRPRA